MRGPSFVELTGYDNSSTSIVAEIRKSPKEHIPVRPPHIYSRVWVDLVKLPILLVVSRTGETNTSLSKKEVLPGALRPAESTVDTQGLTVESGGDGGPTIRVYDVGPPPRTLPVTQEDTPPTTPASYRVPPRARHLPTAFVRSGPQEDRVPKRGSYHSTTATSIRGSHDQTTRRAPPEAADGRNTRRGGRSRQGTP